MFNNPWMSQYNAIPQAYPHFNVMPVGRMEEVKTVFPDLQGKPLFFYDQSRNEFFVKQRNVETGEVQTLRYTLSNEPLKTTPEKDSNYYDEQFKQIRTELDRISSIISAGAATKSRKAVSNDESE